MTLPSPYSESVVVRARAEDLYAMIADVSRMGQWSPVCTGGTWEDAAANGAGSWFVGRNETPERVWETRCLVVAAEPGEEFAFVVGGNRVRWGYRFAPHAEGTEVTESWEMLTEGEVFFQERFGERAGEEIAAREVAAHEGIAATLAALKVAAEAAE